jgi:REP element-mobilizing transposase RayT
MPEYRRHLPHLQPDGAALFLTWRLHGSVSAARTGGTATGVRHLSDARIAKVVADTIIAAESERAFYELHAWVIMPNHVHLLITPESDLSKIMRWIKGSTARRANQILGLTGQPFWQDETWDRWMRNTEEFRKTKRYIEFNPVTAGLVKEPSLWPWSSAR